MDKLTAAEQEQLTHWLGGVGAQVEAVLDKVLPREGAGDAAPVLACMRYACMNGGKRVRAALCSAAYELCGGTVRERPLMVAAAMEMIHAYSLVQDDMPCMDNDDMRRGKPSAHKAYGEAVALLASDGLQTGAYEVLARAEVHPDPAVRLDVVRLFAQASGALGMVAGQALDMAYEQKRDVTLEQLRELQALKTGANIRAAVLGGVIVANPKDAGVRAALETYAVHVGRAFQIWDDVLDVTATAAEMGKTPGKDVAAGKATFVTLLGLDSARKAAWEEAGMAVAALEGFGMRARNLLLLARFVATRGV